MGLTKATSEQARERRKQEREHKKEQVRIEKENETMRVKAAALAKPQRPPVLWPFIDRLGKAFVNTLVNIFLGLLVIAIGAGILYFTRSEEAGDAKDPKNSPIADPAKDCKRGPVELTLVSDPADAEVFFDGEKISQNTPLHNVNTDMCYNVPLAIRVVKGDLSWEQKVDFPVNTGRISLKVKLEKGGGMAVTPESGDPGDSEDRPRAPYSGGTTGPSGMHPPGDMTTDAPPPDGPVDLAGGIGVLKVTCSASCTILIAGKNKGSEKVFRLRARKDPYQVQADFGGGVLSEIKTVYIFPNQDNFAHFSHP